MTKSLILIILIGVVSFVFTDLRSPSVLYSILLPVLDLLASIFLAIWFVVLFYKLDIKQTASSGSGDVGGFGGFDGGGDCDG